MSTKSEKPLNRILGKFFFNKWNLTLIVILVIYFLFESIIVNFIDLYLVKPIISEISTGILTSITFVSLNLLVLIYYLSTIFKPKDHYPQIKLIVALVGILYFYYRFINLQMWILYPYPESHSLFYLDIILLAVSLNIVHSIVLLSFKLFKENKLLKNPPKNESTFILDQEWKPGDPDLANRLTSAEKLAHEIIKMNSDSSFAIGLNGSWGSGKTSFIKMLRTKLDVNEEIILIHFNPWRSTSSKLIISDFFELLKANVAKFNPTLSGKINKYSKKLTKLDSRGFLEVIDDTLHTDDDLETLFNRINATVRHLNKKVVVVIDDMDRLDGKELIEVIRLIRNTANFYNTVFIAAYAKEYVNAAIHRELNQHNSSNFLEKIFQVEISIPELGNTVIQDRLAAILTQKFPASESEIKRKIQDSGAFILSGIGSSKPMKFEQNYTVHYIKTFRDINRFCNSFIYNYSHVEGEVLFSDYLFVELIKLKCYSLYTNLESLLKLEMVEMEGKESQAIYILDEVEFDKFIRNETSLSVASGILKEFISSVFNRFEKDKRSIAIPSSFPIYRSNQLFDNISLVEFRTARKVNFNSLKKFIDNNVSKMKGSEITDIFARLKYDFDDKKDFEILIESLIYMLSINIGYDQQHLLIQLKEAVLKRTAQNYYNSSLKDVKDFLIKCLDKYSPNVLISDLIVSLTKEYIYGGGIKYILNEGDTRALTLKYFEKHLSTSTTFTEETFSFYYTCVKKIRPDKYIIFMDDANTFMKDFVELHPEDYLKLLIRDYGTPNVENLFVLEPCIDQVFSGYMNFERFLTMQNQSSDIVKEIITFYNAFKANGYKPIKKP